MRILHHGAVNGVTGSCHQLYMNDYNSVQFDFNVRTVTTLIITTAISIMSVAFLPLLSIHL
ncbi:hypothetical protein HWV02_03245 [Moritella sp. 28]|nr:hypothetical protein [Moritella sp. 28]QUM83601.1 hypothetical protein HWV02_03245 [Moritella sp. 28]